MKNVLIYGLGKSGVSSARLLMKQGYRVFLYDSKNNLSHEVFQLAQQGAILLDDLLDDLINKLSMTIVSPGVSVYNKDIVRLQQKTKVIGEAELAFFNCRGQVVAVTGTNGKTTTCSLIHSILQNTNKKSFLVGNVGTPLTQVVSQIEKGDVAVHETSSFQLETTDMFKPYISALLNLSPDHLDRHKDFKTYVKTKMNLFKRQDQNCFALLNKDDKNVVLNSKDIRATKIWFSCDKKADVFAKNNVVYFHEKPVIQINNQIFFAKHNLSNLLCAVGICKLLGMNDEQIQKGADEFKTCQHRLQKVGSIGSVDFIDDSKSTNLGSVLPALHSFNNVSLILGGQDKGLPFDKLFKNMPQQVNFCVLYGQAKEKLFASAKKQNYKNLFLADSFDNAVKIAYYSAKPQGTVLLSPACASFDCFNGYHERGQRFAQIFEELKNASN
ncbi:MAG: UDP-N-acetylmuramoyl-L-alanine--D-glutamate ligase [Clostridiales bacterium]|nr:UDP-N-acetylmuramoyl-L-alanine--D-glutamate ligase [Clostridiales bacterium]